MSWIAESKECNQKHYGGYCNSARKQDAEPLSYEEWKKFGCAKRFKKEVKNKAIIKFAIDIDKWIIDVETDSGEVFPVGKMVDEKLGLFEIRKWNSREEAKEWIKSKGLNLA